MADYSIEVSVPTVGPASGTVAWQDVLSKPADFPPSTHTHAASSITSGTLDISRIPTGTTSSTVALGNDSRITGALPLATAGSGLVLTTGSTTARSLATRFSDEINVKDFGAVGNGTTDDTAAIQAAINYAGTQRGGKVHFPAGIYSITSTIIAGNGGNGSGSSYSCTISGCGAAPITSTISPTIIRWNGPADAGPMILFSGVMGGAGLCDIYFDGNQLVRDAVVLRSVYAGLFSNLLIQRFRRRGLSLITDTTGTSAWYSSRNHFQNVKCFSSYCERSAGASHAFYLDGHFNSPLVIGVWGNTFANCTGQVFSDDTGLTVPSALYLGYCDSNQFYECDMNRSPSALDQNQTVVPGSLPTFQGTGRSVIFDATTRSLFPTNNKFYGCSLLGNYTWIEPSPNVAGVNHFVLQTTKDSESPPPDGGKIAGYNDRNEYIQSDLQYAIALRGDAATLRHYRYDRLRHWDQSLADDGGSPQFKARYWNGSSYVDALELRTSGKVVAPKGIRSARATINDNEAAAIQAPDGSGIAIITNSLASTRNTVISYNAAGTAVCTKMVDAGAVSITYRTGILSGTTGTDGHVTYSAHNDGNLYIENRGGASTTFNILFV
jgi:hypothetical protein